MLTLWNTKKLRDKLESRELPEWQVFVYFFITVVYDHTAFTVAYLGLDGQQLSFYGTINIGSALVITFIGVLYVFFQNGGKAGEQFFQRYFSLSVVVGIKFAILILVIPEIINIISNGIAYNMFPWFNSALFITLNIMMFLIIGHHVNLLAKRS